MAEPVVWTDKVGVVASGNTITKSAGYSWGNGGAASVGTIPGDGGVDFRADETNTYRMSGLSAANQDANYASIDYAIFLRNDSKLQVYEGGPEVKNRFAQAGDGRWDSGKV